MSTLFLPVILAAGVSGVLQTPELAKPLLLPERLEIESYTLYVFSAASDTNVVPEHPASPSGMAPTGP